MYCQINFHSVKESSPYGERLTSYYLTVINGHTIKDVRP